MALNDDAVFERESGLQRQLSTGQLTMIAIGGVIGTGLFMGSGIAIGYAGPAVLISCIFRNLLDRDSVKSWLSRNFVE